MGWNRHMLRVLLLCGAVWGLHVCSAVRVVAAPASDGDYLVPYAVEAGDTIPVIYLPEVFVYDSNTPAGRRVAAQLNRKQIQQTKLIYNVRKVYPYAKLARQTLEELNEQYLKLQTDKERKAYTDQLEKDLFAKYEKTLRSMTITQGKILIKLVDRETGNSSYALIKDFRGGLSARFWQTIARLFGANLKKTYDAEGEDKEIEEIIGMIEAGYFNY